MASELKVTSIQDTSGNEIFNTSTNSVSVNTIKNSAGTTALTLDVSGNTTLGGNLVIPNSGTIGSASDTDAITIDSSGNTTLGGNLVIPDSGNIGSASDTDAITIDSSGNVGIGTSTPQSNLDVASSTGGTLTLKSTDTSIIAADEVMGQIQFYSSDASGSNSGVFAKIDAASSRIFDGDPASGMNLRFFAGDVGDGAGSPPERMRINSSGDVNIGNIAKFEASGGNVVRFYQNRDGGTPWWYFNTSGGYGVYSDERLKENIIATEQSDSVEFIQNLQAVEFNWKSSTGDTTRRISGLTAQNVLASAKTEGQKNILTNWETYDENDPDCPKMGLSDHRMIPSIVQALQFAMERIESQQTQIEALTARIEVLENAAG